MRETYYTYITILRLILDEALQVSATQLEEELIMQTSAFFEKEKTNIYLTYILTKVNLYSPNQVKSCVRKLYF